MMEILSQSEILAASILIVDDKEPNVLLLREMLQRAGYTSVSSTNDSRQVGEMHRVNRYDLIILDLQMPGLDGFGVMAELKKLQDESYLPVLVITAQPAHKLRALNSGARDFMSKPFELAEVIVRVRNMIEARLLFELGSVANAARLRNAQRIASLGDWEYDFKRSRLRWSDEVYAILGIKPGDRTPGAEAFSSQVHPDDLDFVRAQKKAASPGLHRAEFEHRLVRQGGEIRHVRQIVEFAFDDVGQPAFEFGTIQDITAGRNAESALRQSEERYLKMLALSPDALFVQVDGIVTFVNEAYCKLMGAASPEQLLGRSAMDGVHPDYHSLVLERRRLNVGMLPLTPIEIKFVRLDGTLVDVETASVAYEFHGHTEVQVIARDISVRLRALKALRDSEERFKLAAQAVSDVVWDWDLATDTVWWNDGFLSTFGFAAGEVEPGSAFWMSLIHEDDRSRVVEVIRHAADARKVSWTAEYRLQRKDKTYAFVHDRGYIIRDPEGKATRMVGGMRDLTERKKLEDQYLRSQRMESIGTLAGGIAHDLNNVLAPIMMAIELLKLEAGDNTRNARILQTIYSSCNRGADLVRQVLSFARGVDHQQVAIRLRLLIDELAGVTKQTFPRNIRIDAKVPDNLWPVLGDPSQLHQVLLNLAVNARDAMPHGGQLTIAASNVTIDAQFAAMSLDATAGTYVLLEVSDTGTGIPADVRSKIFEPFFTTKDVGKGTGLGLATVHTVVKNHGGFLNVESEVGEGTTFKIYLPADKSIRTVESMSPFTTEVPRGSGELVLVIDDESTILDITRQTLEIFGYRAITAVNGAEGAALYAQRPREVAVVITDMMMPIMDGVATIHVLACINPQVRIIAASGLELVHNAARASEAGVGDFLHKPFSAEVLLRKVREVLDRPASRVASENRAAPVGSGSGAAS